VRVRGVRSGKLCVVVEQWDEGATVSKRYLPRWWWLALLVAAFGASYVALAMRDPPAVPRLVWLSQPVGIKVSHDCNGENFEWERHGLFWRKGEPGPPMIGGPYCPAFTP
jgi:hypothetical protein